MEWHRAVFCEFCNGLPNTISIGWDVSLHRPQDRLHTLAFVIVPKSKKGRCQCLADRKVCNCHGMNQSHLNIFKTYVQNYRAQNYESTVFLGEGVWFFDFKWII